MMSIRPASTSDLSERQPLHMQSHGRAAGMFTSQPDAFPFYTDLWCRFRERRVGRDGHRNSAANQPSMLWLDESESCIFESFIHLHSFHSTSATPPSGCEAQLATFFGNRCPCPQARSLVVGAIGVAGLDPCPRACIPCLPAKSHHELGRLRHACLDPTSLSPPHSLRPSPHHDR